MAYERRENSGSLFKNDKNTEDKHPNARGSALIGGVEYWVSAWTKKDKNGNPWQSLAFSKKDEQREPEPKQTPASAGKRDGGVGAMSDDIPFNSIGKGIGGHAI